MTPRSALRILVRATELGSRRRRRDNGGMNA
jgi:hypothetical protein